ncbi:MAG: PolC-type DNA polymerase III [Clostridia bacterium]|nr:PolC-type DNA polymerase III [Clostridia bacterium]
MDAQIDSLFTSLHIHPTEVSFSRSRNELRAYFTADAFVPMDAQRGLREKLVEMMPGCSLDFAIVYTDPKVLLQTDFDAVAAAIADRWLENAPQLRPFFKGAVWSQTDGVVTARVPQSVMHIPGIDAYCKQYAQAAMAAIGLPLTLQLAIDDMQKPAAAPQQNTRPTTQTAKAAPKKDVRKPPQKPQGKLLYGRTLPRLERALPMRDVQENAGTITVCGVILSMESREKKDGGLILQVVLTDRTGAVPCKLFLDPNEKNVAARIADCQKKGDRLIAHGSYNMDNYLKRMCLLVRDLAETPAVRRADAAEEKRVELHLHTKMSSMDALVEPADAVKTAARWGHKAVAITDHGVVQAFPAAVNAANKLKKDGVDIKVILGVEGYLSPDCTLCKWEGQSFVSVSMTAAKGLDLACVFQIAAERFTAEGTKDSFCVCVDTGMPIPAEVEKETGLCEADMENASVLYDALRALRDFANGGIWVADSETAFTLCTYCERLEFPPQNRYADATRLHRDCYHEAEPPAFTGGASQKAAQQAALMRTLLSHLNERGVRELPLFHALPPEKVKGRRSSYHIILLAKNHTGLLNLYRLVSYAHLDHLKKVPRIPKSLLCLYREGLIVGGACEAGEVFRAVLEEKPEQELLDIASFYDYMEIQPIGNNAFLVREERVKDDEGLRALNKRVLELGDQLGKPTVATGDVHFLDPEDAVFRAVLMSARDFKDAEQQAPLYYKTTQEMLEEFAYLGERAREVVIDNPNAIADMCEAMPPFLSEKSTYAPTFPGANDELRGMAEKRAHEIYGDPLPEIVQKRLDKELNSIIGNGYASLYLMAQRLVKKSNDDGYLVGSRGSVGSSFVATMAGITEVNPLQPHYVCPNCKHSDFDIDRSTYACGVDLPDASCPACGTPYQKLGYEIPFETFLGFKGDKTPDIDLNFSGEYQPRAHAYTEVMFGKGHAFRAGTISGLQAKTVYGYVMKYCEQNGVTLGRDEIDRLVAGCCGVKRTTGQHPGGIVIVPEENDIMEFTPIQYPADKASAGTITTHFDFHAMDDRLVKLDILGHVDPTALRMLQDITGLDPKDIPQDDPATMQLFSTQAPLGIDLKALECDVGSIGIPEFGTGFVRQMLMDTRPTTMEELVRIAGLSHGTDVWLGNAQELVKSGQATLRDVICTRDDIMNYLILQGGDPSMSFKTMESVRKGRGLTPEMEEHMRKLPIYDWFPDSCKKIGYMFPRAHAAAYVMMAFRVAYYKVHYPLAFYAVYFQCRAGDAFDQAFASGGAERVLKNINAIRKKGNDVDPKEADLLTALEAVYEMNLRGIELLDVDIYKSDAKRFLIEDNALRPPLCAIAGVGENAAEGVAAAAQGKPYGSIEDFQKRTKANSGVVNALKEAGCLAGLPETNQITLFQGLI